MKQLKFNNEKTYEIINRFRGWIFVNGLANKWSTMVNFASYKWNLKENHSKIIIEITFELLF